MEQQNLLISRAEAEIIRNNAFVERKQTQIDQLNKKIEQALSKLGGVSTILVVELTFISIFLGRRSWTIRA